MTAVRPAPLRTLAAPAGARWLTLAATVGLWMPAPPALAEAVLLGMDLSASAQVVQVDGAGTRSTSVVQSNAAVCTPFGCLLGGPPALLAGATPAQTQQAHAAQDIWGAFGQRQNVSLENYGAGVQRVEGHTASRYTIEMHVSNTPTPVFVDFRWLGSRVAAGSHYGSGQVDASSSVAVMVSRNGGAAQQVWGFEDRTRSTGGLFTDQHSDVDLLGAGLPARRFETEWREFMVWGDIERDFHVGTFDFGVLQPGETLSLTYEARTDLVMHDVPYSSRGELELLDPFRLGQGPAIFSVRGLDLPFATGPQGVPEPGGLALAFAGLAALVQRSRRRC